MKKYPTLLASLVSLALCAACGAPALAATATAKAPQQSQSIQRQGTQDSVKGPAEYFTGTVRVDPLFAANEAAPYSGAYVTFEPGARSAWHTHPTGQRLLIISGVGRTQAKGGPLEEVRPGDIIWCPPLIKHWHGASPTAAMTHMALTGTLNGENVTWMEKVSDAQYMGKE